MEPTTAILGSAAIGAAASFLGGDSDTPAQNYGKKLTKQLDYQRRYLTQAPGWQVEGAKKAGLHPLFAMGQSANAPTPTSVIPGQSVERPSKTQQALSAIQTGLATYAQVMSSAKLNDSMAKYYDSMATANQQGLEADKATAGAVASAAPDRPYKAQYYHEIMPDGSKIRRTSPESAIGAEEVIGPHFDRWLHGSDATKRRIERDALGYLKRQVRQMQKWNPGTNAGKSLRNWALRMWRQGQNDRRWK